MGKSLILIIYLITSHSVFAVDVVRAIPTIANDGVPTNVSSGLALSLPVSVNTRTSGQIKLVDWDGCGSPNKEWSVRGGSVYIRKADDTLTPLSQARERLADCGAIMKQSLRPELKMTANDCTKDRVSPAMAHFMDTNMFSCVQQSAKAAGVRVPQKVFVVTGDCFRDRSERGSRRPSDHAYGDACDIYGFQLMDALGQAYQAFDTNISNHYPERLPSAVAAKNAQCATQPPGPTMSPLDLKRNRVFYTEFRRCWSSYGGKSYGYQSPDGIPDSIIGTNNALHNDHMHLEFGARRR